MPVGDGDMRLAERDVPQVVLMSADEARAAVERIKANLEDVRGLLFDLRARDGWRALGYVSFQACVQTEFQMSQQHAHRLLNAYAVDRMLIAPWQESSAFFGKHATQSQTSPPGESWVGVASIPERHARELEPLLDRPDELRAAYAEASAGQPNGPTASGLRAAVERRVLGPEEAVPERSRPFVMPEQEAESDEQRAYFTLSRQRLLARYRASIVADTPADPTTALPAWEEFEAWFLAFMAALRARAARPIRLAE